MGQQWKQWQILFGGGQNHCRWWLQPWNLKRHLFLGRKATINLDSILKSRDIILPTKVHLVKAMVFPVVIYGYESWMIRKAEYWRTDAFELWCWRRLMDCKDIQLVNPKGNQSLIFIGGTDAEAETPILWPPDVKNWLIGKDPDAGKDWRQEEKGTMEDEMFGWYHRLNGHEFPQTPGDGDGQGSLVCCRLWGHKESDTTEWLNWTVTWKVLRKTEIKREITCFLAPTMFFPRYKKLRRTSLE